MEALVTFSQLQGGNFALHFPASLDYILTHLSPLPDRKTLASILELLLQLLRFQGASISYVVVKQIFDAPSPIPAFRLSGDVNITTALRAIYEFFLQCGVDVASEMVLAKLLEELSLLTKDLLSGMPFYLMLILLHYLLSSSVGNQNMVTLAADEPDSGDTKRVHSYKNYNNYLSRKDKIQILLFDISLFSALVTNEKLTSVNRDKVLAILAGYLY